MILLPFAKLGCSYVAMHIIHWLIAIGAVALFLFKSPINNLTKLLFIFSYYMIFEYSVVARNYGLTILFLFLIATYYNTRFSNPYRYALLIVALYNCNLHSFGAAVGLSVIYIYDASKEKKLNAIKYAFSLILIGALLVIIQLWPSANLTNDVTINTGYLFKFNINTIWVISTGIQNAFIPIFPEYEELKIALFFTFFLGLFFILFTRKVSVFIFLTLSCFWLFYVFSTKLSGSWRHEGLILVFLIFTLWINKYYSIQDNLISKNLARIVNYTAIEDTTKVILIICLFVNSLFGINTIKKDYHYNFSGSKEMANFIIANKLENSDIACYRSWRASAIAPYLPNTKLWFVDREEFGTYFILDTIFKKYGNSLTEEEVIKRTQRKYSAKAFLLLNEPLSIPSSEEYNSELMYQNKKYIWGADDEKYFLYKIWFRK